MKKMITIFLLSLISLTLLSQIDTMKKVKYKTIVISDLHLGFKESKVEECIEFLKNNSCENLFLDGDIIDGWRLQRGGKWTKTDSKFIKKILKLITENTKVIYLRGNHDDFLETLLPFVITNDFQIESDYTYESFGKKYLIMHGDIFDPISSKVGWMAKLGSVGYDVVLHINRHRNKRRVEKGLPYKSISNITKKTKFIIRLMNRFENAAVAFAKQRHCDGIICGHIHAPEDKMIHGIHYLNSGDWVDAKTALVEDFEGNWKILYY